MSQPLSYADEGTIAHKLFEMCVRRGLCSPLDFVGKKIVVKGEDKQHSILSPSGADSFLACMGSIPEERRQREAKDISAIVTKEMANAVEVAIDYVRNIYDKMKKPTILPEQEVWIDCLDYDGEDGHGTMDLVLYNTEVIHVMDYKHGQGIVVEVEENKQAMLYGIGELDRGKHKNKKIILHILQPRASHPDGPCRPWSTDIGALRELEADIAERVANHDPNNITFNPGDKQCRYCWRNQNSKVCEALAEKAIKVAGGDFKQYINKADMKLAKSPGNLNSKQLANAMSNVRLLEMFIDVVKKGVMTRVIAGDKEILKHYKLVEGKSNRQWRSEDTVMKEFKKLGINLDLYAPRKLVGIGTGEDILPKQKRERFMTKHTYKPNGSPVLATADDPRKPIASTPNEDFAEHIEDES